MDAPRYLRKIGDPPGVYHIWTPLLAEREDMLPYDPFENAPAGAILERVVEENKPPRKPPAPYRCKKVRMQK